MSQNPYQILGIDENATPQEVDQAYYALRDQYREQLYQEGTAGKAAARKLNEIEDAYHAITQQRTAEPIVGDSAQINDQPAATQTSSDDGEFAQVAALIKQGDLKGAQRALDDIGNRNAEWHFYQSNIYYKKGWLTESQNQLQMACDMEPANQRYANALDKLKAKIAQGANNKGFNESTQGAKRTDGYQRSYAERDARYNDDACCSFCQTLICCNCLMDCCCRG